MDRLNLLVQADELADLILQTPEVIAYREAETALNTNGEATNLLRRLKELREQVAEFQARRVPPMHYAHLLEETDQLMKKMENIPELKAFESAQHRIEELFDSITAVLTAAVHKQSSEFEHPRD